MARPTRSAQDFDPALLAAFDQYVHGDISRREFLNRAGMLAVGGVSAASLLGSLSPNYAQAQDISADDARIVTETVTLPAPGEWNGYLARPAAASGALPTVLVIHENRGRNPYIEDVARRLAVAGFLALAPDALSPFGGWPGNDDEGRALQAQLDGEELFANWVAALHWLRAHPDGNGKVGAVGFCYGGGVVNRLAASEEALTAGVPYYGSQVAAEQAARIRAPLLIHNAENDARILAGAPAYEAALRDAGVAFEAHVYEGVEHGFHNNSTPRFDAQAADLSWQRTLTFFDRHLRG